MKTIHPAKDLIRRSAHEGKGSLGCLFLLFLFGVAVILGFKLVPLYYANSSFESDVKTEASRAGARFLDDEMVTTDILDLAKRHEIRLKREDIRIERRVSQLRIIVHYTVPVDFVILQRDLHFEINASSFIGRL